MSEVTRMLNESGAACAARLLPVVYAELRRLAASFLAGEKPGQTLDAKLGKDHLQVAATLADLGLCLLAEKNYAQAEAILRDSLAIREKKQPEMWNTFNARAMLGGALLGQKKFADAEPLIVAG